ncbi:hypothetical protein LTR84_001701 [Exophiala bonariae]|uniref:Uncharacterized protein n=1 Tax=Exophiala bonariae TaxID=1690606 RepID=A0AAV9NB23_9EURO|nr:hypothetical protein LTR84_001701 [Exophiala bonariae]
MRITTRRVSDGNVFPISNPRPLTRAPAITDTETSSDPLSSDQQLPSRPRHPALLRLHKFRTIVIPVTVMLVFTTLILGAIYAYCVAKPHTSIADQLAVDSSAEVDGSIFSRRSNDTYFVFAPTNTTTITEITRRQDDTDLIPASKDPQQNSNDTTSQDRDNTEPQTALLFYTLTTPAISLIHLTFELIMHHHTPQHLSKRLAYIVLLTSSSLLAAGWLTTLGFWMHCELPPLNSTRQDLCPIQVRGHFMYGIHEVSIAKTVVAWLIAFVYLGHVVCLAIGWAAMKRVWRITGAGKSGGLEHGQATEIVVSVDDQLKKETYLASGGR